MSDSLSFEELGLTNELCSVLQQKGYEHPTFVQQQVIPEILQSQQDLIVKSATGSGKTGSFGIPLVQLLQDEGAGVQALVLAPTRELAIQVSEEIQSFQPHRQIDVVLVCGGQSITQQIRQLKKNTRPTIVVGTPGRVNDLLNKRVLNVEEIQYLVLDEVDEMLDMGFKEEVDMILSYSQGNQRSIVVSATLPKQIQRLLSTYLTSPKTIEARQSGATEQAGIDQSFFTVQRRDKLALLFRLIDHDPTFYGVVFCATKRETEQVAQALARADYQSEFLHGDLNQAQREAALAKFKSRKLQLLVVTDVAARGIDIKDVTYVINYDLPQNAEKYTHRIGRTGRAGKKGQSITFVNPSEMYKFDMIQRRMDGAIVKGTIPSIGSILTAKNQRLDDKLQDMTVTEAAQAVAKRLLDQDDAEVVVAKLLTLGFSDLFNKSKYPDISAAKPRSSRYGGGGRRDDRGPRREGGGGYQKRRRQFGGGRSGGGGNRNNNR